MGIVRLVTDRGVFPRVDEPAPASRAEAEALKTSLEGCKYHQSAGDAPDVGAGILERLVQQGWALSFGGHSEAARHFNISHLVLIRLGFITKVRGDGPRNTGLRRLAVTAWLGKANVLSYLACRTC